jgi:dihydroorotase
MLTLIKNAKLVNEGQVYQADVLIENQIIKEISSEIKIEADYVIDAKGYTFYLALLTTKFIFVNQD